MRQGGIPTTSGNSQATKGEMSVGHPLRPTFAHVGSSYRLTTSLCFGGKGKSKNIMCCSSTRNSGEMAKSVEVVVSTMACL